MKKWRKIIPDIQIYTISTKIHIYWYLIIWLWYVLNSAPNCAPCWSYLLFGCSSTHNTLQVLQRTALGHALNRVVLYGCGTYWITLYHILSLLPHFVDWRKITCSLTFEFVVCGTGYYKGRYLIYCALHVSGLASILYVQSHKIKKRNNIQVFGSN
jgi:hypothetical protein